MRLLHHCLAPLCGLVLAAAAIGLMGSAVSCSGSGDDDADPSDQAGGTDAVAVSHSGGGFIGAEACAKCHQQQHADWVGSHHEQAMKVASEDTVLGDFNDATFEHFGVTSRFFKKDGRFFVNTDGPDGKHADFEIAYTFGVEPLQQYLVKFPGGRVQALTVLWDARPKGEGGQRWYHLYPDEAIPAGDALHWTGPNFTWNHMCAECHSTDLQKHYDAQTNSYKTRWAEINVSCEACHGPGKDHAEWAALYAKGGASKDGGMGLKVVLKDKTRLWVMNPETGIAQRQTPLKDDTLVNACARCHARRGHIHDGPDAGAAFLDHYHPSHLEEGLYFPDGQIQDEVYVWGSFVQSRMHMKGVTCVDCHDPHTARVPQDLNQLCSKCHQPSKYDAFEHHKHPANSTGAQCVNCHMPHRTYMGVDDRRDHSFRIPRPDLSLTIGTPNACSQCHTDQSVQWAADQTAALWGVDVEREEHFGVAFSAARDNEPGADQALLAVLRDEDKPQIVRGTAAMLLMRYPTRAAAAGMMEALASEAPMVRLAAAEALSSLPEAQRVGPALGLLDDPLRSVRIDAGLAVADIAKGRLSDEDRAKVKAGIAAYKDAQLVSADTAPANMNLGNLAYRMGDRAAAAGRYERALAIDPSFVPAYANLATLYAEGGQSDKAIELLNDGLARLGDQPDLYHARALLHVRQRDYAGALASFAKAYAAGPGRPDIAYAYAVALHDTGSPARAIAVLKQSVKTNPNNPQALLALAQYSAARGDLSDALKHAKAAQRFFPEDPGVAAFVQQLQAQQR